mgnify:CR=1 FL=1
MPARAITASAPPTTTPVSAALDVSSDAFEDAAAAAEVLLVSALDEETSFFDVSAFELEVSDFESAFEVSVFDSPPSAAATPKSSVIESAFLFPACDLRTSLLCYLACFLIDLVSWSDMYSYSTLCVLVH